MKKVFNLTLIAIALVATTMTSCRKTFGEKEVNFNYQDNTENTFTVLVTDSQTGNAIEGAVIKNSEGNEITRTSIGGTATYIKKANDKLVFTVESEGYATMFTNDYVEMCKLDGKFSGIATYTDKAGNVKPVPSDTEIYAKTVNDDFVVGIYKTTVGADGKFEFTGLPNGASFEFVEPTIIADNPYSVSGGFTAATVATPKTVQYSYIGTDLPLAVVSSPGVTRATNNIVIKFNKAVDKEYTGNIIRVNSSTSGFTAEFSTDGKTLTLTPTTEWSGNLSVSGNVSTAADPATGRRQDVAISFTARLIE